jgi:hypothetical protein
VLLQAVSKARRVHGSRNSVPTSRGVPNSSRFAATPHEAATRHNRRYLGQRRTVEVEPLNRTEARKRWNGSSQRETSLDRERATLTAVTDDSAISSMCPRARCRRVRLVWTRATGTHR